MSKFIKIKMQNMQGIMQDMQLKYFVYTIRFGHIILFGNEQEPIKIQELKEHNFTA